MKIAVIPAALQKKNGSQPETASSVGPASISRQSRLNANMVVQTIRHRDRKKIMLMRIELLSVFERLFLSVRYLKRAVTAVRTGA